ncbi:MAG: type II toxin-antitoxin system HicA family toxin [Pirellulaceae bacterium]|nr:type II toxin-antitoxin system HicA family toxin [Pirellulaceae bacterium]
MNRRLTAIIQREGDGYVSLCPELDIASQGDTVESARENLREALELFFACASPEEVQQRMGGEVFVTQLEVAVGYWRSPLGRLRALSGLEVCAILERQGFREVRRRGSHLVMQHASAGGTTTVPVPDHRVLRVGMLRSITRQSGISRSDFET